MNDLSHPSSILDSKHTELIRNEAAQAEKNGKLTKNQLNLAYEQQWFKILAPSHYGGSEYALPQALHLEEALAWADGSIGWMVTLCAGAGWIGGFTDPGLSQKIFADPKACIAGSDAITGTAEKTKNGYIINGQWPHACGAPGATAFTGSCAITQNGKPLKDEKNKPKVLTFLFFKNEVTILPPWNTMGLIAAAGNGYKVNDLALPEARAFKTSNEAPKIKAPLYNYPLLPLAEATLAVNISGMAIHFTDLFQALFKEKKTGNEHIVQDTFEKYAQRLHDARAKFYYAIALSWQASVNSKQIKEAILYKVSAGAFDLSKKARECVDALYPYCGLAAATKDTEINRVWRDLHTASQHSLLAFGGSPE